MTDKQPNTLKEDSSNHNNDIPVQLEKEKKIKEFMPEKVPFQKHLKKIKEQEEMEMIDPRDIRLKKQREKREAKQHKINSLKAEADQIKANLEDIYKRDITKMKNGGQGKERYDYYKIALKKLRNSIIADYFLEIGGLKTLAKWISPLPGDFLPGSFLTNKIVHLILSFRLTQDIVCESGLRRTLEMLMAHDNVPPCSKEIIERLIDRLCYLEMGKLGSFKYLHEVEKNMTISRRLVLDAPRDNLISDVAQFKRKKHIYIFCKRPQPNFTYDREAHQRDRVGNLVVKRLKKERPV